MATTRCIEKTANGNVYQSEEAANKEAKRMSLNCHATITAFRCSHCNLFHIGRPSLILKPVTMGKKKLKSFTFCARKSCGQLIVNPRLGQKYCSRECDRAARQYKLRHKK